MQSELIIEIGQVNNTAAHLHYRCLTWFQSSSEY